jgi:hypothetical protein
VWQSVPLTTEGVLAGGDRVLEPFSMSEPFAWDLCQVRIADREARAAAAALREKFGAHDARRLHLWSTHVATEGSAVYLPAFVFECTYAGLRFRFLVNGVTGAVGGDRLVAPVRAGAAALVASWLLASAVTTSVSGPAAVALTAGALAAALAAVGPRVAKWRHDMTRQLTQQKQRLDGMPLDREGLDAQMRSAGVAKWIFDAPVVVSAKSGMKCLCLTALMSPPPLGATAGAEGPVARLDLCMMPSGLNHTHQPTS